MAPFNFNPLSKTAGKTAIIDRINLLSEKIKAALNLKVTGARIRRGPDGANINVRQGGGNIQIVQFRVQTEKDDYLECYEWDGSNVTGSTVNVAKPWLLQRTPFNGNTIGDETYTYYDSATYGIYRKVEYTDTGSTISEYQYIVPLYRIDDGQDEAEAEEKFYGDVIYAIEMTTGVTDENGGEVIWQDMNLDGRNWCT